MAPDGSQGTFFGVLSVAGALAGTAGYYVGSWLVVDGARATAWLVFGTVGALGVVLTLVLRAHAAGPLPSEAATA